MASALGSLGLRLLSLIIKLLLVSFNSAFVCLRLHISSIFFFYAQIYPSLTKCRGISLTRGKLDGEVLAKTRLQEAHRLIVFSSVSFTHDLTCPCLCESASFCLSLLTSYAWIFTFSPLCCAHCSLKPVPFSELHELFAQVLT